jgi:hypothetical protein
MERCRGNLRADSKHQQEGIERFRAPGWCLLLKAKALRSGREEVPDCSKEPLERLSKVPGHTANLTPE